MRLIPGEHRNKLKKAAETNSPTHTKCELHIETSILEENKSLKLETQDLYPRKKKKNKITNFPEEFEDIDRHLEQCESSDWKTRLENMSSLAELCRNFT